MRLSVPKSVHREMARAIRLGYRIELPRSRNRKGQVALLTLQGSPIDQCDDVEPQDLASAITELLQGRAASGDLEHGRWGRKSSNSSPGACRYCSSSSGGPDGDHPRTMCRGCDMPQCLYPSKCRICLVGYLNGISYGLYGDDRQCGYKGCTSEAVAEAPHVKRVCRDHLDRPVRRFGGEALKLIDEITSQIALLGQTYGVLDWQRTHWFAGGAR
ncbi:hypothetical protein ACQP2T_13345 [Nonomuraea sp. CA-143628]|uniref:hypothetical protein n=1 Tax=Nonomuraea sp. CA-143628 TaxID=3239997 RepID=UPI003D8D7204